MGTLLVGTAVAAALGSVRWGWFSPGILACAAAELALCCRAQKLAALSGSAVLGAALCAADPALAPAAAGLGCATAAAAVLAPGRRVETLAAYAGGCVSGVLCVQPPGNAFGLLFSACGGMAVVCLLPGGWLVPVADTPQSGENAPAPARSAAASTRLEAVAQSLSSLAETVNAVYEVITIKAGDQNKNIDTLTDVWTQLSNDKGSRHSLIINLGGGMVTDLGGFAASTFKRGIAYINIPTTLLAMVDASVGGKTGINFNGLKNEIGVFSPARFVLLDTEFLKTLDSQNIRSGYAEMLKHGLISNDKHWAELINFDLENIDYQALQALVAHSVSVKEDRSLFLHEPGLMDHCPCECLQILWRRYTDHPVRQSENRRAKAWEG